MSIDIRKLESDIQNGKLPNTEIIRNKELVEHFEQKLENAKNKYMNNSKTRNKDKLIDSFRDLSNIKRDGECLIKGCVPSEYLIKEK